MKKLNIFGCSAWILGLIVFITGLNLDGSIKDIFIAAGSIFFLTGLFCVGICWYKNNRK